jgi:hypothetical protein
MKNHHQKMLLPKTKVRLPNEVIVFPIILNNLFMVDQDFASLKTLS